MDAAVGTDIDRKVAAKLGLKLSQVQRRRVKLGRPFLGAISSTVQGRIQSLPTEGMPYRAIASELGIGTSSVHRARKLLEGT